MNTVTKTKWILATASLVLVAGIGFCSAATVAWDGGGDGLTWEDPLNWAGDILPGPADEAFIIQHAGGVELSSNQTVLEMVTNKESFNHTGGTLTLNGGDANLNGGSFDDPATQYNMSGNAQLLARLFLVAGGVGDADLTMRDSSRVSSVLNMGFGGDGGSSVTLHDSAMLSTPRSLFLDPTGNAASLSLNDSSTLSVGSLFMNDGLIPGAGSSSMLSFIGSSVTASSGDLLINGDATTLLFVADAGGVSPLMVAGSIDLDYRNEDGVPALSVDLSAYADLDPLVLIDGMEPVVGQFRDLPEGSLVPGSGGRRITYTGGDGFDVMLLAVPEPSTALLVGLGWAGLLLRRRRGQDCS